MYSASDLFNKAYSYAVKNYDFVAILSAKYGLLFNQMKSRLRLEDFDKVFFHAGRKYREYLIPKLQKIGICCEAPLKDPGIGKQKAWYKEHH